MCGPNNPVLTALRCLAYSPQVLELPCWSLPHQVAGFTALEKLVVPRAPERDTQSTWDAILFNLG